LGSSGAVVIAKFKKNMNASSYVSPFKETVARGMLTGAGLLGK
jgi:hypothetical protein